MAIATNAPALFSSLSCEWPTLAKLFEQLDQEFHFTLDACATRENARCKRYFDRAGDGISRRWAPDTTWMNPPYGRDLGMWMCKAHDQWLLGATVVALVPARTDTFWFRDYALRATEIRFLRGRLRFGDGKGRAPFPSCCVIWRAGK